MNAYNACDLAYACGLQTTYEAYDNVLLHASSLFVYDQIATEVAELKEEIETIGNKLISDVFPGIVLNDPFAKEMMRSNNTQEDKE